MNMVLKNSSLKYAPLAALMALSSTSSLAAAESKDYADPKDYVSEDKENLLRMDWDVSNGIGIDFKRPGNPLLSSRLSINGIPLTLGKVPIFGRPSLDLSGMIESPVKNFVSDTRESLQGKINLLSFYLDTNRNLSEKGVFDYIEFSPEFRIIRTKRSSLQVYGGGSVGQGVFSLNTNSEAIARVGFQAGSDYLVSVSAEMMIEGSEFISAGGVLEGIFPGVKENFAGYLFVGPKIRLNFSNQGMVFNPYFMLNGFSVSEADVRNREFLPMQAGLNISYHGYEIFGKKIGKQK